MSLLQSFTALEVSAAFVLSKEEISKIKGGEDVLIVDMEIE